MVHFTFYQIVELLLFILYNHENCGARDQTRYIVGNRTYLDIGWNPTENPLSMDTHAPKTNVKTKIFLDNNGFKYSAVKSNIEYTPEWGISLWSRYKL